MFKSFIAAVMVVLFSTGVVFAHPASDAKIEFIPQTRTLKVTFAHKVSNTAKHYIEDVDVLLNGKSIITQKFVSQYGDTTQEASYTIVDINPSSEITVMSECNLGGKFKKIVKINDIIAK